MKECHIGSEHTIRKYNDRLKELGLLDWKSWYEDESHLKKVANHYWFPMETSKEKTESGKEQKIIDNSTADSVQCNS